jgi:Cas7 group CRISPR-associated protein Csh2
MSTPAQNDTDDYLPVITGLLVVEVRKSNPNGDPDNDGAPRTRSNGLGEISAPSSKRKSRDLVADKEGVVWLTLAQALELKPEMYAILEERRNADAQAAELKKLQSGELVHWDGRLMGNTELKKGENGHERIGALQFGVGLSIAPVEVETSTWTNKAGVEADKDRGMAPNAYKVVAHGLYAIPFFINPTAGHKSGCTMKDVRLFLELLKYIYSHTRSVCRTQVELIHAHVFTHNKPLGSCRELSLIAALTPKKLGDPKEPSTSLADYVIPQWDDIKDKPAAGTRDKTYAQCGSYQDWALFD